MSKKIMIADDAEFMRQMIKDILKEIEDVEFFEAKDGIEAVKVFEENSPDLSIIDVTMPGKDGLSTIEDLKLINKQAKIIMCSFLNQQDMVVKAFCLGAEDFVKKPFKPERMLQAVKNLL